MPIASWLCCLGLLSGALLTGCEGQPDDAPTREVERRLVGTWLRDYEEDGARVRRVLVLDQDGLFRETSRATRSDAIIAEHAHAGAWHFDGTNLKRRYTSIDGEKPSAPKVPYATFAVTFPSRYEFVGTDNVRKREVRYQRVPEGALP